MGGYQLHQIIMLFQHMMPRWIHTREVLILPNYNALPTEQQWAQEALLVLILPNYNALPTVTFAMLHFFLVLVPPNYNVVPTISL